MSAGLRALALCGMGIAACYACVWIIALTLTAPLVGTVFTWCLIVAVGASLAFYLTMLAGGAIITACVNALAWWPVTLSLVVILVTR